MKVDSFVYLLVIAVVLLVVISLFSGSFTAPPEETGLVTVEEFSLGTVGASEGKVTQTISLGNLNVGETQEELLKELGVVEITQGLTGGNQEEFTVLVSQAFLEMKKGVRISFTVLEAAALGNLHLQWNGKEFYSAAPSGLTEFEIPKDFVFGENNLKIWADGPGIQFWAATSYTLRNFRVHLLAGPHKIVPFELLPSELQTFERGEVSFFGGGSGTLTVKVNGASIFSKTPSGTEKAEFTMSTAPLNAGSNVLSFSSSDSNLLSGTVFRLYTLENQLIKTRSFDLTESQVKSGKITFTVNKIIKSGVLEVRLNEKKLDLQLLQEGDNPVAFSAEDVVEGKNTLRFSGTGAWDITSVKVGVA